MSNPLLDNEIMITDENGVEQVMKILFTYENEERHKMYAFLYKEGDEDNVIPVSVNEKDSSIEVIEDEKELEEVEEVFNCFLDDPKMKEIK